MNNKATVAGSILSAGMLVVGGVAAYSALMPTVESNAQASQSAQATTSSQTEVANADGAFTYSQDAVSTNESISSTFSNATAAQCNSAPDYDESVPTTVNGSSMTVSDVSSANDVTSLTSSCACASNQANGGAIMNAQVSGTSIADIVSSAQSSTK